jgi:hypothetical protein
MTALATARLRVLAVVEHLAAIADLIDAVPPREWSMQVIARSVVEVAARAWWLLDPAVELRTSDERAHRRVERSFVDRLHSAYQAERLAAELQLVGGVGAIHPSFAKVAARASALGLAVGTDRWRPSVGSQVWPGAGRLVAALCERDLVLGRGVYPLYSAVTHGSHHGLLQGFRDFGRRYSTGEPVLDRAIDHRSLEGVVAVSLIAFRRIIENITTLTAWNRLRLDGWWGPTDALLRETPR